MRFVLFALVAVLASACGRDEPQLFVAVRLPSDPPDACLPLRAPPLDTLSPAERDSLRLPSDDYVWLVGETFESPGGLGGAVAALTGRAALVSLTSQHAGRTATRAIATIEKGEVTHTYFGTPLTPAFAYDDAAQLSLTFEARQVDAPALVATKAVLTAVTSDMPVYGQVLGALAPARATPDPKQLPRGAAQTYVLRDPATCRSGACQAVLVDERLVFLQAVPNRTARELAETLCLKGSRLHVRAQDGKVRGEHQGGYAVMRVAHARLPEEALGEELSTALSQLARCDGDFTPDLARRASDLLARNATLRAVDRAPLASLLRATGAATRAQTPEALLDADRRLREVTDRVCSDTPADGIVCARARRIATCAASRVAAHEPVREPYVAASRATRELERATSCETRGRSIVSAQREIASLAEAVNAASIDGKCQVSGVGLSCEAFPDLSRRTKAAIADAQERLYRDCYCEPLRSVRPNNRASELVRASLRCDAEPDSIALAAIPERPVREEDLSAWRSDRDGLVPPLTSAQCPSCARLSRHLDAELSRAIELGRHQAAVIATLRETLEPVTVLHDRATVLMTGEASTRCVQRPDEWRVIVQALEFEIVPRDLFREGGGLVPSRLKEKLAQARLLLSSLDGLSCAREEPAAPSAFAELPPD